MKKRYLFAICATLAHIISISGQNLLTNGDFESGGNGVGFNINSGFYNAISQPFSGSTSPGNYAVTTNPQPMNINFFISGGDHTSDTGNMLVVDGTTTGGGQRFWRAGSNGGGICGLTVGATYTFSYWIKSVSIEVTNNNTRANIGYQFNNASNVTLIAGFALAPLPDAGWQQVKYTFTPTNSCVNFELWDNNTNAVGNDFAVDDFELYGPPQPLTLTYSVVNPSCPGANDGYIIAYGAGANLPYVYFLDFPSPINNATGVFLGLGAGTYSLKILEAADGEITINNIVLTDPQDLTVSAPVTICAGASTVLSVSGNSSGYNWTAVPTDSSLVDTTSANPTVSPTQTTTYTVTSTSTNTNNNLIFNADFSAGNVGFQTNYVYYPSNSSNLQRAYGIATNSNSWEIGFSSCLDHTSGSGKMMVVDGSNINGGNDKVWCQTISVSPNQDYTFKYFIQTLAMPSPANIDIVINGVSIGSALAPSTTCSWVPRQYVWNSGTNTTAQICIYDRETAANGNDFAIDDLSFIGAPILCNLSKSVTVTVNNSTTPTFDPVASICSGGILNPLPTTSLNDINGTWAPPLNNTTTTLYTFTPNPNQCATTATLQIAVYGLNTVPTFAFGSAETYCYGTPIDAPLPTFSTNAITGTWSSAGINTQLLGTTDYIFTPNSNQCASPFTLSVTILPNVNPEFVQVNPICLGETLAPLPTISNNNVSGSWLPPINSTATSTYTFTPNSNQCASNTTMTIIVNDNATPIFDFGDSLTACFQPLSEGPPAPLPTVSNNGIEGSWSPFAINYSLAGTNVYTFTPNNNLCATPFILTVTIIEVPTFTVNAGCDGENFVLSVTLFEIKENSNFTWYNDQNEVIGNNSSVIITTKGTYKVVKEINGCSSEQTVIVPSVYCKIPKGISPNDDTLNDFFDLSNLDVKELQIYNRYGTEVYAKKDYRKEWNGRTNDGNELPDGTYYYVINFETGTTKTGWIYINKEY
jgi:gliding motility-associated-like protein